MFLNKKILIFILFLFIFTILFSFSLRFYFENKFKNIEQSLKEPQYINKIRYDYLKKVKVPEKNEKINENIVSPSENILIDDKIRTNFKTFDVEIKNDQFLPSILRVYKNDVLEINLKSLDKDYDIYLESYNLKIFLKKDEIKTVNFQALKEGIFNFYCSLCENKEKIVGKIIVVPR